MGNAFNKDELTPFRRRKLMHEFNTFFDVNKNGSLEWKDFDLARQKVCDMGGWKAGSEKYQKTNGLFKKLWTLLQDSADEDCDGQVSREEWLAMWNRMYIEQKKKKKNCEEESFVPDWMENYIEYKFNMYDRTGDGEVDADEFEYVLGDFGVPPKDARAAFLLFSQNNQMRIDKEYFRTLTSEYFLCDEPSMLGNFITGRLDFSEDDVTPNQQTSGVTGPKCDITQKCGAKN